MRLLVSVRDAHEAAAAIAGGADLIDAKEPHAGALGAVALRTLWGIVDAVGGLKPVTAAVGDARDERSVADDAAAFTRAGAMLIKVGLAGIAGGQRLDAMLRAATRGAGASRVVAVAYADYGNAGAPPPGEVIAAAARAQIRGVLIDTFNKQGAGLTALASASVLTDWVAIARRAGLLTALAGKLTADDLLRLQRTGADVAGVRGAACDSGRFGTVTMERVRVLRRYCRVPAAPAPTPPAPPATQSA
jgi:uncharacterized protein (UPF0264 family)